MMYSYYCTMRFFDDLTNLLREQDMHQVDLKENKEIKISRK